MVHNTNEDNLNETQYDKRNDLNINEVATFEVTIAAVEFSPPLFSFLFFFVIFLFLFSFFFFSLAQIVFSNQLSWQQSCFGLSDRDLFFITTNTSVRHGNT